MFIVQSGPIRRSLVALSTATVAADDEADDIIIIFSLLFSSLPFPLKQHNSFCLSPEKIPQKEQQTQIFPWKNTPPFPYLLFGCLEKEEKPTKTEIETLEKNIKREKDRKSVV